MEIPEIVIAVKKNPDNLENYTICGIDSKVLQVIPKKSKDGFLMKFVDGDGNETPVYRVRVVTKLPVRKRREGV